jgi:hypothetical protein
MALKWSPLLNLSWHLENYIPVRFWTQSNSSEIQLMNNKFNVIGCHKLKYVDLKFSNYVPK